MVELLAPAGNEECFFAAINNGADAVYLGMNSFSARKNAGNFNEDNIKFFVAYAHSVGVKVYVALNTIVKDDELERFMQTAAAAYRAGADAFIVQDVFWGKTLRDYFPDIELHLSTQAGINNVEGALLAKEYGFKRVILARETEKNEIKKIAEEIETEIFVHGALCSSFSGHCYISSFIGGNSGNRGLCKQPCRKKYKIETKTSGGEYSFSLADLNLSERMPDVLKLGVNSLKIEGRMRTPEYVAAAVRLYRKAIDGVPFDESEITRTYNRGNYTEGYAFGFDGGIISDKIQNHIGAYYGKVKAVKKDKIIADSIRIPTKGDGFKIVRNGYEVGNAVSFGNGKELEFKGDVKIGDEIRITKDVQLSDKLNGVKKKKRKIIVDAKISEGELPVLSSEGIKVYGDEISEKAKSRPVTSKDIEENLLKTDVYPFEIESHITVVGEPFIVKSKLNALRASLYEKLFFNGIKQLKNSDYNFNFENNYEPEYAGVAIVRKYVDLPKNHAFVLFPDSYDDREEIERNLKNMVKDKYLFVPAFLTERDISLIESLLPLFDGIYADGLSALAIAEKANKKIIAGTGLNVFNSSDIEELNKLGIKNIVYSKELSLREINNLHGKGYVFTFGSIKLAEFLYCPFGKKCLSCSRGNSFSVTDETGHSFTLRRYKLNGRCRFELLNGDIIKWDKMPYNFYDFTSFSETQIKAFFKNSREEKELKFTNGNLKRGIL